MIRSLALSSCRGVDLFVIGQGQLRTGECVRSQPGGMAKNAPQSSVINIIFFINTNIQAPPASIRFKSRVETGISLAISTRRALLFEHLLHVADFALHFP
jgi:hypothetical protein